MSQMRRGNFSDGVLALCAGRHSTRPAAMRSCTAKEVPQTGLETPPSGARLQVSRRRSSGSNAMASSRARPRAVLQTLPACCCTCLGGGEGRRDPEGPRLQQQRLPVSKFRDHHTAVPAPAGHFAANDVQSGFLLQRGLAMGRRRCRGNRFNKQLPWTASQ